MLKVSALFQNPQLLIKSLLRGPSFCSFDAVVLFSDVLFSVKGALTWYDTFIALQIQDLLHWRPCSVINGHN